MSVTVRSLVEFEEPEAALAAYHALDDVAFGQPPTPGANEAKRPLIELDRWYLAEIDGEQCGGAGSFPFELTVPGGGVVPVAGVSDVGVLPTHRRRGVLRALIERQFRDLTERGQVAAVLHASEAGIYRRFGYGPATRWRQVDVDVRRAAFHPDWPAPGGRYRIVDRSEAAGECAAVHDRARRLHPGGLTRTDAWWQVVLGDAELYIGGGNRRLVLVHTDDGGRPDGYAIYEIDQDWSGGQAAHRLRISELVGLSASVELGLLRTLFDHDLVARVSGAIAVDHVLWDVLVDPRQARTVWEQDMLWARLLDVPAALAARAYATPGTLTLQILDPARPESAGTVRLEVTGDGVECRPVDATADLVLDVSDLGSCWLGGGSFRRLALAGRVHERTERAAMSADRMFGTDPVPWCWVRF